MNARVHRSRSFFYLDAILSACMAAPGHPKMIACICRLTPSCLINVPSPGIPSCSDGSEALCSPPYDATRTPLSLVLWIDQARPILEPDHLPPDTSCGPWLPSSSPGCPNRRLKVSRLETMRRNGTSKRARRFARSASLTTPESRDGREEVSAKLRNPASALTKSGGPFTTIRPC